jgi:hypothetical protein
MGGVFSLWGAVVAAFLLEFLPALLQDWGVPNDWLIIIFGAGVLQVLTMAPAGIADQFPKDMRRLGRFLLRTARGSSGPPGGASGPPVPSAAPAPEERSTA